MDSSKFNVPAMEDEEDYDVEDEEEREEEEDQEHHHDQVSNSKKVKMSVVCVPGKKATSSSGGGGGGGGPAPPGCQVEKCDTDLTDAKKYHKRHKVCELHAKASVVIVGGLRQRFCQQCSRFHGLSEFDDAKRSCRRRLAGHNERRRKGSSESRVGGSSLRGESSQYLNDDQFRLVNQSGRSQ